jgi:hypothetical protein
MRDVKRWLPSRRFVVVLATLLVLGSVGGVFFHYRNTNATASPEPREAELGVVTRPIEILDSDGDGLKDWEEVLWQTDPNNPDSDGDGTADGDEVREGRNPTLPGPDDLLTTGVSQTAGAGISGGNEPDLSETERFSRSIFSQYIEAGGQGAVITSESAARLIIPGLLELQQSDAVKTSRVYAWDDVNTVPETDTSLKAYGNTIGNTFKGRATEGNNEVLALVRFAQTGDPAAIGSLEQVIATYSSRIETLQTVPVPESLVGTHVTLLNALSDIHDGLIGFSKLASDPIQTLLTINRYRAGTDNLAVSLRVIAKHLTERNVTFAQSEGGAHLISAVES